MNRKLSEDINKKLSFFSNGITTHFQDNNMRFYILFGEEKFNKLCLFDYPGLFSKGARATFNQRIFNDIIAGKNESS